jgi:hypothetical protein
MQLTHEEACDFANNLADNDAVLTEYEVEFVESMIKISFKPGVITLTKSQCELHKEISNKLSIYKLRRISKG